MFVPEAELPMWLSVMFLFSCLVTKKAGRSSETDLLAMGEREIKAMNLPELSRGASNSCLLEPSKLKKNQEATPKPPKKKMNKLYKKELALALLFLTATFRSLLPAIPRHYLPPRGYGLDWQANELGSVNGGRMQKCSLPEV